MSNMLLRRVPHGANGVLTLPQKWWGVFPLGVVYGGPFRNRTPGVPGICLLESSTLVRGMDLHCPIEDFSVPHDRAGVDLALKRVFEHLVRNQPVWVGCMGGWGRTGLFLALIAKTYGIRSPVEHIREHYTPRAVETREQERYVRDFNVKSLESWLVLEALRALPSRFASR